MKNLKMKKQSLFYRRSHFITHLPIEAFYSPSHSWLVEESGLCRVGFTKFATRMLGEMIDHKFEITKGMKCSSGQIIGWVEGFKAISDVYSIVDGKFERGNPALEKDISLVSNEPYERGWLYEVCGKPEGHCMDVKGYVNVLNATIDKILEEQKRED